MHYGTTPGATGPGATWRRPGRGLPSRLLASGLLVVGFGGLATTNALAAFDGRRAFSPASTRPLLVQPHRVARSAEWDDAPGSTASMDTEIRLGADDPARLALWGTVEGS